MEITPVDLFYEELGQGTPVIFLHGFPFDHSIWLSLAPLLQNEARLILPDLRGFGRSPVTDQVYSMRLLAEDVVHLMDRLEIERAVLVGHSMGGYVSLAFAQAYPHRLSGLALAATQSVADNPERRQSRYKTAEQVTHKGARVVSSNMVDMLTPRNDLREVIRKLILQTHPSGIIGALKGMAERPDMTGELSKILVPAVVLAGQEDQFSPMERAEMMAQMLPKGWLVQIPHAGHMIMMEDPQRVADSLRQLIQMADQEA